MGVWSGAGVGGSENDDYRSAAVWRIAARAARIYGGVNGL